MLSKKIFIFTVVFVVAGTTFVSGFVHSWREAQERSRLENILIPVIASTNQGPAEAQKSISFLVATEKSIQVVVRLEQKAEPQLKSEMRERIIQSIRRELSSDPKSWGRHIAVNFDDEVITQGWK